MLNNSSPLCPLSIVEKDSTTLRFISKGGLVDVFIKMRHDESKLNVSPNQACQLGGDHSTSCALGIWGMGIYGLFQLRIWEDFSGIF